MLSYFFRHTIKIFNTFESIQEKKNYIIGNMKAVNYPVEKARVGIAGKGAIDFAVELATNPNLFRSAVGCEARTRRWWWWLKLQRMR